MLTTGKIYAKGNERHVSTGIKLCKKYLSDLTSDDVILDIGCGTGEITQFLATSGGEVTGIDNNLDIVHYAKQYNGGENISYEITDAQVMSSNIYYNIELLLHYYNNSSTTPKFQISEILSFLKSCLFIIKQYHDLYALFNTAKICVGPKVVCEPSVAREVYNSYKLSGFSLDPKPGGCFKEHLQSGGTRRTMFDTTCHSSLLWLHWCSSKFNTQTQVESNFGQGNLIYYNI